MTKKIIAAVVLVATIGVLAACDGKSDKKDNPGDTAQVNNTKGDTLAAVAPSLICREIAMDSFDIPRFQVVLAAAGKETIIDTVNGCSPIGIEVYKQYGIPGKAISACGGWYAGAGDYFYLLQDSGKLKLFAGWQDEGQTDDGYHWEEKPIR